MLWGWLAAVNLPAGLLSKRKEPSHTTVPLSIPYTMSQCASCYGWTPAHICYRAAVCKQAPPARLLGPGQLSSDAGGLASGTVTQPQAGIGSGERQSKWAKRLHLTSGICPGPINTCLQHHDLWLLLSSTIFGLPVPLQMHRGCCSVFLSLLLPVCKLASGSTWSPLFPAQG